MITLNNLNLLSSKDLGQLARDRGISGWYAMRKVELIEVLLKSEQRKAGKKSAIKNASSDQKTANRVTNSVRDKTSHDKPVSRESRSRTSSSRTQEGNSQTGLNSGKVKRSRISTAKNSKAASNPSSATSTPRSKTTAKNNHRAIAEKIKADREQSENRKNLAGTIQLERSQDPPQKDRLILIVRDSFWLQAYWEITKATMQRTRAALENHWHQARPVLRLMRVTNDGSASTNEDVVDEFEIHGGVKNWYFHLKQKQIKPGSVFLVSIGYVFGNRQFYSLAKSNLVCPLNPNVSGNDENWFDLTNDIEKYFALSGGYDPNLQSGDLQEVFEEKSRHPIHAPAFERLGSGINGHLSDFEFRVDAHLIVHGNTNPNGTVTINGEPVRLQSDGSFSVRMELPERRQVFPVVASSRDGTQQRTTVLAIERNTKIMDPVINDMDND